jgi:hypothetical protein
MKKYKVPKELRDKINLFTSNLNLRDRYVKIPFGFKKARKLSHEAFISKDDFWASIFELYPEVSKKIKEGKTFTYDSGEIYERKK